ncbi:MAG: transporter substrate-binding domain-containing protein [Gammaproteobacteria bacterium]|jgi:ABC-type amino acid transport substrate-binding protein
MNGRITVLLAAWLLLVCNPAVVAGESTFPDIQRILDAGALRVAIRDKDTPPVIMIGDDGTVTGAEADLARDLAEKMGVAVEFVRTAETYDGVIEVVARREADLGISFLSSDVRRAKRVFFSRPYLEQKRRVFYNRAAFVRLKRDLDVQTFSQLAGTEAAAELKIGVVKGSIYGPLLRRDYLELQVQPFPDLAKMVEAVKAGRVYAGFHGGLQVDYYMRQHPETAIYIGVDPEAHYPSDISIAVRPDAPNLLRWVDVYLAGHVGQLDASKLIDRYAESRADDD